jgi:cbb3-type cytochrome oxidase maturation protein
MATQMLIVYLIGGAAFALFVLVWALRSRQFQEQERAKWLPLRDLEDDEVDRPPPKRVTPSVFMIFVILVAGLGVLAHLAVRLLLID